MSASSFYPERRAGLLLLAVSLQARAEAETQTELSCLFHSPELAPRGGDATFATGDASGFAFEELASRGGSEKNALRLATAVDEVGYFPGLTTQALLRLELGLRDLGGAAPQLRDVSSWLGVDWRGHELGFRFRAFPFDTDYLRLGHLHWLDWGGTDGERGESVFVDQEGGVPGIELELRLPRARLFTALKWTREGDAGDGTSRRWGIMFGGHFAPSRSVRLDAGFGYFARGPASPTAAPAFVEGASFRIACGSGPNEPELAAEPFRSPSFRDESHSLEADAAQGTALALELAGVLQRVRGVPGAARSPLTLAPAAALYGSVRGEWLAAHAALAWRSLPFVLRSSYGLVRGEELPADAASLDEWALWAGLSAELGLLRLVPSAELGCLLPAGVRLPGALPGTVQTFVVRDAQRVTALPLGAQRLPVFASRLGVRFEASALLSLALFGSYERDANRVGFRASALGPVRVFAPPDSLTLTAGAWARF